jgi:hypothetical protein
MRQYWLAIVPIVAVALGFYLNRRAPDVRYQLTTPIPVEAGGMDALKSVQLLEVANLGNAPAQKLRIQVKKKVGSVNVVPNSMADAYKQYDTGSATELVYETLPPQGRFRWIFTTTNGGVTDQDLTVSHLDGLGQSALTSNPGILVTVAKNSWILIGLAYLFWIFKDIHKSGLESDARYHPLAVLKRKRPLFVSDSTWERIRSEAIDHAFRDEWSTDLLKWEGRNMLDSDCPSYLTGEEWQKLVNNLTKMMVKLIDSEVKSARTSWHADTLGFLLKLKRPRHFSEREWNETVENLRKNYVACLVDSQRWRQPSEMADVVRGERPGFLTEEDWRKCKRDVGEIYYARLAAEVATFPEPMDKLAERDLSVLSDEQQRALRRFAYHKQMADLPDVMTSRGAEQFLKRPRPKWMAEEDYASLRDAAERYQELVADKNQYDSLMKAAQNLLAGIELSSNPPLVVAAEEWAKVKAIEERVRVRAQENSRRAAELDEERSDLEKLKSKVLRQLDVLDRFLQDPDVADRIEPYEEVFAPGNLANLKEIAGLARAGKRS